MALDYYVDYSANPDPKILAAYHLSILSPQAAIDLAPLKKAGHRSFAYLSVVEVASDAPYSLEVNELKIPVLGLNAAWGSTLMDITTPAWKDYVVSRLAARAAEKGFDGFFLDTADSVEILADREPARAENFRSALADIVRSLRSRYPDKPIILNRGFKVWERVREQISGVLIESMFRGFDAETKEYRSVPAADTQALTEIAKAIKAAGLEVFVLDYVEPTQMALADQTARRIEALGFSALVSTHELDGVILGPLREAPRTVLVLFGNHETEAVEVIKWASDSGVAQAAQVPLEWLGYEVDYMNPSYEPLPDVHTPFAAIVLDRYLDLTADKESLVADWLIQQKVRGRKIVFMGSLPFDESEAKERIVSEFGLGGTATAVRHMRNLRIVGTPKRMNYEGNVRLVPTEFLDLTAPTNALVYLTVEGEDGSSHVRRFDPIFVAAWGGALLDPYVHFRRPDFTELWMVDPFAFFSQAIGTPPWPAPDTTTRDGLRAFYSHIDGDGFRHKSAVVQGKRSAEIIIENVVKKYPFPFTCSIIEAEIRGFVADQPHGDDEVLASIARDMFALPNVEAASHSFSHPFFWAKDDRTAALYDEQQLDLKEEALSYGLDLDREINGSVRFIEENLLPIGKKVAMFLWSGNCRPPPEALRMTQKLGIENMNGGDTIVSRKNPSLTKIAPRCAVWNGELQIFASHQNENVYREQSPLIKPDEAQFHGAFIHIIESFELMETPRRLQPVNIYFHFYSGDSTVALRAVTQAFDWVMTRAVHSVTASQYARIVRDCRRTRLFRRSDREWLIFNNGELRTFRLDPEGLVPDLAASKGITGFNRGPKALYVHTDGSPRVELKLTDKPQRHVYLVSSSAEIRFEKLDAASAAFSVADLRPCKVTLGGLPANRKIGVRVNDKPQSHSTDDRGQLILELPKEAKVTVSTTS